MAVLSARRHREAVLLRKSAGTSLRGCFSGRSNPSVHTRYHDKQQYQSSQSGFIMMDGLLRPEKRPRNDVPSDLCNNAQSNSSLCQSSLNFGVDKKIIIEQIKVTMTNVD